eukprot:scaffold596_cov236-Pinguiococcus_pyrenoidosus.AAC.28
MCVDRPTEDARLHGRAEPIAVPTGASLLLFASDLCKCPSPLDVLERKITKFCEQCGVKERADVKMRKSCASKNRRSAHRSVPEGAVHWKEVSSAPSLPGLGRQRISLSTCSQGSFSSLVGLPVFWFCLLSHARPSPSRPASKALAVLSCRAGVVCWPATFTYTAAASYGHRASAGGTERGAKKVLTTFACVRSVVFASFIGLSGLEEEGRSLQSISTTDKHFVLVSRRPELLPSTLARAHHSHTKWQWQWQSFVAGGFNIRSFSSQPLQRRASGHASTPDHLAQTNYRVSSIKDVCI